MAGDSGETLLDGHWTVNAFTLFLVQAMVIGVLTHLLAAAFKRIHQPAVVADIVAGIVLGPTVMGHIPGLSAELFPAQALVTLGVFANVGLIAFMFVVGMELDVQLLKADLRSSVIIALSGICVPGGAACGIAYWLDSPEYMAAGVHRGVLSLFFTVILGISALPVLARILSERNMLASRLGALSMSVAACDDVVAWVLLAFVLVLHAPGSKLSLLWTVLLVVGECVAVWLVVKPAFALLAARGDYSIARTRAPGSSASPDTVVWALLLLLAMAYLTEVIGISAFIGAFQAGLMVPRDRPIRRQLIDALEPSICALFVPLYFAYSGLRTDFGLINSMEAAGVTVALIVIATAAKVIGILVPALWLAMPLRISCVLGVLMSCKGLVALIVANYGIEYDIITPKLFAIIVFMVLMTTMQTVPLVLLIDPPSRAAQSAAEIKAWEDSIRDSAPPAAASTSNDDQQAWCETASGGIAVDCRE